MKVRNEFQTNNNKKSLGAYFATHMSELKAIEAKGSYTSTDVANYIRAAKTADTPASIASYIDDMANVVEHSSPKKAMLLVSNILLAGYNMRAI